MIGHGIGSRSRRRSKTASETKLQPFFRDRVPCAVGIIHFDQEEAVNLRPFFDAPGKRGAVELWRSYEVGIAPFAAGAVRVGLAEVIDFAIYRDAILCPATSAGEQSVWNKARQLHRIVDSGTGIRQDQIVRIIAEQHTNLRLPAQA